jgi:hypothetical protein
MPPIGIGCWTGKQSLLLCEKFNRFFNVPHIQINCTKPSHQRENGVDLQWYRPILTPLTTIHKSLSLFLLGQWLLLKHPFWKFMKEGKYRVESNKSPFSCKNVVYPIFLKLWIFFPGLVISFRRGSTSTGLDGYGTGRLRDWTGLSYLSFRRPIIYLFMELKIR